MESGFFENLKRFFSPKKEVLKHWYAPVDNFQFVTADFYRMIEKQLTDRKVPGLDISRVELGEGGLLSGKREYLRLRRERLVFDICAAPFGSSYFFSFRFVELPLGIKPAEMLVFIVGLLLIWSLLIYVFGTIYGIIANPYTRIVFRVGDADAKRLADGFAFFEARDLQNLETGRAIARIEKADNDFNLTIPFPESVEPGKAEVIRHAVIAASRAKYATPRADVETVLLAKFQSQASETKGAKAKPPPLSQAAIAKATPPEIPKETVSEKDNPPPVEEVQVKAERMPPDLGKGGAQHKAIQQRLKESAEQCGFYAAIEKEIPTGSIDLFVEKAGYAIACEISVTTTIDHEVGNALKCLREGFLYVAIICQDEARLQKIESSIVSSLGPDLAARVSYFQPDQFISHLREIGPGLKEPPPVTNPASKAPTIRRGYTVRRTTRPLTGDEHKSREQATIEQLAALMKRKD